MARPRPGLSTPLYNIQIAFAGDVRQNVYLYWQTSYRTVKAEFDKWKRCALLNARIESGVLLMRTVDDAPEQVETFFLERTAPCQTA